MYPVENIYTLHAYDAWRRREELSTGDLDLHDYRQSWPGIVDAPFWEVSTWDELRTAVSFLTLMNKRHVLYFRGQRTHSDRCLPVLLRDSWHLAGREIPLSPANRGEYYAMIPQLAHRVLHVAMRVGTPRSYILQYVPAAAASVLQHYELWPTHFIDVTRSLATAVTFGAGNGDRNDAFLYVFAMPDLRGSITSDIDQHLTLSRLEAICPPAAKRPHHQDAYLVSRFPEPVGGARPGDPSWDDWQSKTDLNRRLCAKFRLTLENGWLPGTPPISLAFLMPDPNADIFGERLHEALIPTVTMHVERIQRETTHP